jgi:protein-disulfide isomerase
MTKDKEKDIEWITRNVAEPEAREIAVNYKIRFVPTTIINGETRLVGVTTVEQLLEEIAKQK